MTFPKDASPVVKVNLTIEREEVVRFSQACLRRHLGLGPTARIYVDTIEFHSDDPTDAGDLRSVEVEGELWAVTKTITEESVG